MTTGFNELLRKTPMGFSQISAQDAAAHMDQFEVIDVRGPGEYAGGHIPGAKLAPLDQLAFLVNTLPKDKPLLMVCRSGQRSSVASQLLVNAGFDQVINLEGGMMGWAGQGHAVEVEGGEAARPAVGGMPRGAWAMAAVGMVVALAAVLGGNTLF